MVPRVSDRHSPHTLPGKRRNSPAWPPPFSGWLSATNLLAAGAESRRKLAHTHLRLLAGSCRSGSWGGTV